MAVHVHKLKHADDATKSSDAMTYNSQRASLRMNQVRNLGVRSQVSQG